MSTRPSRSKNSRWGSCTRHRPSWPTACVRIRCISGCLAAHMIGGGGGGSDRDIALEHLAHLVVDEGDGVRSGSPEANEMVRRAISSNKRRERGLDGGGPVPGTRPAPQTAPPKRALVCNYTPLFAQLSCAKVRCETWCEIRCETRRDFRCGFRRGLDASHISTRQNSKKGTRPISTRLRSAC